MCYWIRRVLIASILLTLVAASSAQEQPQVELVMGPEQIWRTQFIVLPGGLDKLTADERADLGIELGVNVRNTADIVMLRREGSRPEKEGEGCVINLIGKHMGALRDTLNTFGGVILSFGSYSHEVYIGQIFADSNELLFLDQQLNPKRVPLSEIAAVKANGASAEIIYVDGAREKGILISPFYIQVSTNEGAITGVITNLKFKFEAGSPEMCNGTTSCEIQARHIFLIYLENGGVRIVKRNKEIEEVIRGMTPRCGKRTEEPEIPPGEPVEIAEDFRYEPCDPVVGEAVKFEYPSERLWGKPIVKWEWDFGDGETSDEPAPLHSYDQSARYLISLRVTNNKGEYMTICRPIYVWLTGKDLLAWEEKEGNGSWVKRITLKTADQNETKVPIPLEEIYWSMILPKPLPSIGTLIEVLGGQ